MYGNGDVAAGGPARKGLTITTGLANRNHEKFLEEAILSCLNQSHPPDEMILIDDGSDDNSYRIMCKYADLYPGKVQFIRHDTNIGHIYSYNELIKRCTSDVFHLMAADDALAYNHFYRDALAWLEAPAIGFVTGKLRWMDAAGRPQATVAGATFVGSGTSRKWLEEMNHYGNVICGGAVCIKSSIQKHFLYDPELPFSADFLNWINALTKCHEAVMLPEVVYHYRRGHNQMTADKTAPDIERNKCRAALQAALQTVS